MEFDRFTHERERLAKGCERIAGVDEAGRGPLAGPVVAAAAVFSPEHIRAGLPKPLDEVNDSKKLSAKKRESLFELLRSLDGFEFGIALVEPAEIDRINILQATHRAMNGALAALGQVPGHVLVDGRPVASLGQALFSVMMALSSDLWLGQAGSLGIFGIACWIIAFADEAFFWRQAMTVSTETGSSSTFQQS